MTPDELYLLRVFREARWEYQIAAIDILEAHPDSNQQQDKLPEDVHTGQITILAEYRYRRAHHEISDGEEGGEDK